MPEKFLAPLLTLIIFAAAPAQAQIVFENTRVELHASAEDEVISGTFNFQNKGFANEEIIEVESSCGCLSATMDKKSYAPDEKGRLRAIFKLSNFVGTHEKTLTIRTGNPKTPPIDLEVQINVPEVFRATPDIHEWAIGSDATTRKYAVDILGDDPITITDISATRTNIDFKVNTLEPGRRYEIEITPNSTEKVTMGALILRTDSPIPKFQKKMLFFSISPVKTEEADS